MLRRADKDSLTDLMKAKLIVAFFAATVATTFAEADYVVNVSGMSCAACRAHVREAFAKLEGVKTDSIKIDAPGKDGVHRIVFHSASDKLTKELAVKSLGDAAKRYTVENFAKAEPAKKG